MAGKDDSFAERRRQREKEAAKEAEERAENPEQEIPGGRTEKQYMTDVDLIMRRAEPMVEQINGLYNSFLAGIEVKAPTELRKQLEFIMKQLETTHKPAAIYQFRYDTLYARFSSHKNRWDKMMRDLESGKIKRVVKQRRSG